MHTFPPKLVSAKLDYGFNFNNRLEIGETVVSSQVVVTKGAVVTSQVEYASGILKFFAEGGVKDEINIIEGRLTTDKGRVISLEASLPVE